MISAFILLIVTLSGMCAHGDIAICNTVINSQINNYCQYQNKLGDYWFHDVRYREVKALQQEFNYGLIYQARDHVPFKIYSFLDLMWDYAHLSTPVQYRQSTVGLEYINDHLGNLRFNQYLPWAHRNSREEVQNIDMLESELIVSRQRTVVPHGLELEYSTPILNTVQTSLQSHVRIQSFYDDAKRILLVPHLQVLWTHRDGLSTRLSLSKDVSSRYWWSIGLNYNSSSRGMNVHRENSQVRRDIDIVLVPIKTTSRYPIVNSYNTITLVSPMSKKKAVLGYYGPIERGIEYTTESHIKNIVVPLLEGGYSVDLIGWHLKTDTLDGVQTRDTLNKVYKPFDSYQKQSQTYYDTHIHPKLRGYCKTNQCGFEKAYSKNTVLNAFRMMYSEHQLGLMLDSANYDFGVVVSPDLYLLKRLDFSDIESAVNTNRLLVSDFHVGSHSGEGITNGFYAGSINNLQSILSLSQHHASLYDERGGHNYERLLYQLASKLKIDTLLTAMPFCKIRHNNAFRCGNGIDNYLKTHAKLTRDEKYSIKRHYMILKQSNSKLYESNTRYSG